MSVTCLTLFMNIRGYVAPRILIENRADSSCRSWRASPRLCGETLHLKELSRGLRTLPRCGLLVGDLLLTIGGT